MRISDGSRLGGLPAATAALLICLAAPDADLCAQLIQWEPDNLASGQVSEIRITEAGTVFVVTGAGLFRSTNQAQNWQQVYPEYVYGPVELPGGDLLASEYFNLLISSDGGATWRKGEEREVRSFFRDGDRVFAGGAWGELWLVGDGGQPWTLLNQPVLDQGLLSTVAEIYARGDVLVYKLELVGLMISRDGGATWEIRRYYTPPPYICAVGDLAYLEHHFEGEAGNDIASTADFLEFTKVSDNPVYLPSAGVFRDNVFAVGALVGPYVSLDGGVTWTLSADGLSDVLIYALAIDPHGYLYAGTYRGVQRSTLPLVPTPVERLEEDEGFTLKAVAPDPFQTQTTFTLLIDRHQHVHLALFNVAGQCVRVLGDAVVPRGEHRLTFDARGLAAGTYFVRAVGDRAIRVQRLTLIR